MGNVYYQDDYVTLYHGDAREILPSLNPVDCIITDPVWPNAISELAGSEDPIGLFTSAARFFPDLAVRAVIHLGCDSDPRILSGVPKSMPFFRVCWLRYARPHYKGRLLYGSDVAYIYGAPPRSRKGAHIMPGEFCKTTAEGNDHLHPCPRSIQHVSWLVNWFADGSVLDPFCGRGTTLRAAKRAGFKAIGIEIEERYCELAARSLEYDFPMVIGDANA